MVKAILHRRPRVDVLARCGRDGGKRVVNDLTTREQRAERTAPRFLRLLVGAWGPLAKALRYEWDSIQKVATGKRAVTPALALRVAQCASIAMDAGRGSRRRRKGRHCSICPPSRR